MNICPNCGQVNEAGTKFCTSCGSALTIPAVSSVATKKEFLQLPDNLRLKKDLKTSAIVCYICAGLTLVLGLLVMDNPLVLIDAALVIGLGLGIHLKQSKVCAILLCAYALYNMIYALVTTGKPAGYLVVIAGVYALISTFKLDKAWKQYQQEHGV